MQIKNCYELGYISKAHGIKGEVKAVFDVTDIFEYEELESVYLLEKGKLIPFFVESMRMQAGDQVLIKFKSVQDRTRAESLRSCKLLLPLDQLPELEKDSFYYHDVIGYTIQDQKLGELGTITDVMEMPGQDLIAMKYKGKEILIPISKDVVLYPDTENKKMFTLLPEGLLEIYLD